MNRLKIYFLFLFILLSYFILSAVASNSKYMRDKNSKKKKKIIKANPPTNKFKNVLGPGNPSFLGKLQRNANSSLDIPEDVKFKVNEYIVLGKSLKIKEQENSVTSSIVTDELNILDEYYLKEIKQMNLIPDYSTVFDFGTNITSYHSSLNNF